MSGRKKKQAMQLRYNGESRSRILTVTLNPSIDRTLWVPGFEVGKTLRADRSEDFAGGKGVNTSRVLKRLGVRSTATGLLPATASRLYREILEGEGIEHDFVMTEGRMRTNVTVLSDGGAQETHIRDRGVPVPVDAFELFMARLDELMDAAPEGEEPPAQTYVVCSGSLPEGLRHDCYAAIIERVRVSEALAFLDSSGTPFTLGLQAGPTFIKPNRHEVEEALGFLPQSDEEYIRASRAFHRMGIPFVMISCGDEGLLLSDERKLVWAAAAVEHPLSTVGSGDAAVAGMLLGMISGMDIEETARLACALGSANTLIPGGGRVEWDDVLRLYERAQLRFL
jgi:1-phosphofructokinase family hexose kinase